MILHLLSVITQPVRVCPWHFLKTLKQSFPNLFFLLPSPCWHCPDSMPAWRQHPHQQQRAEIIIKTAVCESCFWTEFHGSPVDLNTLKLSSPSHFSLLSLFGSSSNSALICTDRLVALEPPKRKLAGQQSNHQILSYSYMIKSISPSSRFLDLFCWNWIIISLHKSCTSNSE